MNDDLRSKVVARLRAVTAASETTQPGQLSLSLPDSGAVPEMAPCEVCGRDLLTEGRLDDLVCSWCRPIDDPRLSARVREIRLRAGREVRS